MNPLIFISIKFDHLVIVFHFVSPNHTRDLHCHIMNFRVCKDKIHIPPPPQDGWPGWSLKCSLGPEKLERQMFSEELENQKVGTYLKI